MAARASHIFSLPIRAPYLTRSHEFGFPNCVLLCEALVEWQRVFLLRYLVTSEPGVQVSLRTCHSVDGRSDIEVPATLLARADEVIE